MFQRKLQQLQHEYRRQSTLCHRIIPQFASMADFALVAFKERRIIELCFNDSIKPAKQQLSSSLIHFCFCVWQKNCSHSWSLCEISLLGIIFHWLCTRRIAFSCKCSVWCFCLFLGAQSFLIFHQSHSQDSKTDPCLPTSNAETVPLVLSLILQYMHVVWCQTGSTWAWWVQACATGKHKQVDGAKC